MNPTTLLSISLTRSDWLIVERLLAAHYSGHVAEVDASRTMPILGVIGRAREMQVQEAAAAPDWNAAHPEKNREYVRAYKQRKKMGV